MDHNTENLEHFSSVQQDQPAEEEKAVLTPRPKSQLALAWIMIAVVLLAFAGTCYWMIKF